MTNRESIESQFSECNSQTMITQQSLARAASHENIRHMCQGSLFTNAVLTSHLRFIFSNGNSYALTVTQYREISTLCMCCVQRWIPWQTAQGVVRWHCLLDSMGDSLWFDCFQNLKKNISDFFIVLVRVRMSWIMANLCIRNILYLFLFTFG